MSSHHNQRFFNLHHEQVDSSRERKQGRLLARLEVFREQRGVIRAEINRGYLIGLAFTSLCFVYIAGGVPLYLNYILSA